MICWFDVRNSARKLATVYSIWFQRNEIVHKGEIWTEEKILKSIKKDVKSTMEFKAKFHCSYP